VKLSKISKKFTFTTSTNTIAPYFKECNKDIDTIITLEAIPLAQVSLKGDSFRKGERSHESNSLE
jgi:hypothetical protein